MLTIADSFIEYLQLELDSLPVHWVRVSAEENSNRQQMNAVNVTVLDFTERGSMEEALISLDILGDDERIVWGWAKAVRDVLRSRQYTPEIDYATTPASPKVSGQMVEWDGNKVKFTVVAADTGYFHLNSTIPILHARM